ncbi:hypothetical protein H9655_08950 [Cytobacillus sp. Sa5YUA1]|uniref:Uncharacterized protein n=1 Tax=Cytobacillus stercorigallinarum TaxID=2762240 RepID=A0ABR8QNN4_9BACI|nr:hypothetical protein [Cytobacillus stercorigallinarum]MBD7937158.1 hypothetical protein [Cytobacillus stercorigallinarum]
MKQPNIKIYGVVHKVKDIRFNDNGEIEKICYQISDGSYRTVFKGDEIITKSLTSTRKIQKPTEHPYHDFSYAPSLEGLLC